MAVRPAGHRALLVAASAQFAARGFHAVSIREIAAAAGVSLSALYHYYPSKQALLAALLHEGMDDYQARCAEALAEDLRHFQVGEPITARPAGFPERALKWAKRRPALIRM